jgi:hypothetical protein
MEVHNIFQGQRLKKKIDGLETSKKKMKEVSRENTGSSVFCCQLAKI